MPSFISPLLAVVQVLSALAVIVLVLLQQGKGADMGSSFGGGSAGSLFGSTGAANFFSRVTKWVSILFFACTLGLAYIGSNSGRSAGPESGGGVMQGYEAPAPSSSTPAPAAPQPSADLPVAPAPSEAPAAPAPSTPAEPDATDATPAAPAAGEAPATDAPATEKAPSTDAPAVENTTPAAPASQPNANTETKQ
ncbi:preprotein translocase subunit SecG [Advenella sp. S44]|uniref:preprotein translocase subunit SecG n=1 Tax=Advenella sp. S44 TaxID=1982755 RepID=UPI000C299302|nr:preprotein translocase subunit SecG [Advenella sp. S44]PJX26182.1 preprotein translocase subunit SecG [Advenella sp. S44]